jgi:hypothetical protein
VSKEELINAIEEEINRLDTLPSIEEVNFKIGYRKAIYDTTYLFKTLKEENDQLHSIIKETKELLSKYNDNESNYYAPIDIALNILDKVDKEK